MGKLRFGELKHYKLAQGHIATKWRWNLDLGNLKRIRLNSIIDSMDINLSKHREVVKDRKALHAAAHEVPKSGHDLGTKQQQPPGYRTAFFWTN